MIFLSAALKNVGSKNVHKNVGSKNVHKNVGSKYVNEMYVMYV